MTYEPEIIISPHRDVFQNIAHGETKAVCWDATNDADYQEMYKLIQEYKNPSFSSKLPDILSTVENYAHSIIDTDIHPVVNKMERFASYHPLQTWITGFDDFDGTSAAIPHRDYPCVAVFLYFNDKAEFNTRCIPDKYSGEPTDVGRQYNNADKSKVVDFPAQSVAVAKIHETTHFFDPSVISKGEVRVAMNARYDCF